MGSYHLQRRERLLRQEQESQLIKPDSCSLCNSSATVFDAETSETVCSSCGMVIHDNVESLGPEWRIYSGDDVESKRRTGMPTSWPSMTWDYLLLSLIPT